MTERRGADMTVGIIGLGYVGLPLATAFAEAGLKMFRLDTSADSGFGAARPGASRPTSTSCSTR